MKWVDYREKLGIGFDDEQKFEMLSTIFQNYISHHVKLAFGEKSYMNYCQMVGEEYLTRGDAYHNLSYSFKRCKSTKELITKYIAFLNTFDANSSKYNGFPYQTISQKDIFAYLLQHLEELNIQYEILTDNDGVFIFPKGAKELDDALVSEPLQWLSEYPQTRKEWIDALKDYSNATEDTASDVADKFRKVLERFFQEFFKCSKTLENMKSEYGTYIKSKGVPPEISNNFETLLQSYTSFMNGYAKHHDKTSKNVLEYIMYQTGNIIRLLITLKKEEKDA